MNAMTRLEESQIEVARIRALQASYADAHRALTDWGLWCLDKDWGPHDAAPSWPNQIPADRSDWAEEPEDTHVRIVIGKAKAEGPERQAYDEKLAVRLDEIMHGPGRLPEYVRIALKTAYATREVPEYQFPLFSNCSTFDQFVERLEAGLRFAGRWV